MELMKKPSRLKNLLFLTLIITSSAFADNTSSSLPFDEQILTNTNWGINPNSSANINLLSAWKKFKQKKEIVVAVVDTGIDNTHPMISKNIFVEEGSLSENNFGVDFSKSSLERTPVDTHGHGSHIAGIIQSIYPNVKILALKYYNPSASGDESVKATVKALNYAIDHNVDIINYSGGGPGAVATELAVLKEAEKKGIMVIAAAGNKSANLDSKGQGFFPASYGLSNIITVTAHDENLTTLDSSNYGANLVDISAPGYRIKSALSNGRVGFLTGTSQATAFVTGVAALIKSKFPTLSMMKIKNIIKNSARKETTLIGKCNTNGRLDAGAALELAERESGEVDIRTIASGL